MESGSKPEKSTGYSRSGKAESGAAYPQQRFTEREKDSQALSNAPSGVGSSNSVKTVYPSLENLPAALMALKVMEADFQEVKNQMPARIGSKDGKVYISVELPGKILAVENGKILVDGVALAKILAAMFPNIPAE